jgi:putative acyl-CoA dehydrogenase
VAVIRETHEVFNQPKPLVNYNLFDSNRPLRDALKFNAPQLDTTELSRLGATLGSATMQTHARLANTHAPELHSHDRSGRRIDHVEFHPSYHALMSAAVGAGLHGTPWAEVAPTLAASRAALPLQGATPPEASHLQAVQTRAGGLGAAAFSPEGAVSPWGGPAPKRQGDSPHVLRAAGFMLFTELEPSTLCPISMTYAVTPALRSNAAIYADWGPRLTSRAYDPVLKPWQDKPGLTMGMGMTEKQGGSDVRANTTRAEPAGSDNWGKRYALTGHKWFMSAPMSDAFLVLAQTPGGLSCFFLPRVLADGSLNALRIQRLKDKLGNQANASRPGWSAMRGAVFRKSWRWAA